MNAGFTAHEREVAHKKVAETLKHQQSPEADDMQKKEPATKNVTGPPVYYPPGHEMFAQKEEGGGAWRAQVRFRFILNGWQCFDCYRVSTRKAQANTCTDQKVGPKRKLKKGWL